MQQFFLKAQSMQTFRVTSLMQVFPTGRAYTPTDAERTEIMDRPYRQAKDTKTHTYIEADGR